MILQFKSYFDMEKKSVFLINFFLIILVILFLLFKISLKYFFYFDIILTFLLSYLFFKKSRKLAKTLITTNLFIFFYFIYPDVSEFLYQLLEISSYVFVIFYNILISYLFLFFSGKHKVFLKNIRNTNFRLTLIIGLVGIFLGFLFYVVKEPIPSLFIDVVNNVSFSQVLLFLLFNSFMVALSEQMIFAGFLFNTYEDLTTRNDAIAQTSIIFVLFHILRFNILVTYYFKTFNTHFMPYFISYYILIFGFMVLSLYLYSLHSKKYKGTFIYPLLLHFVTDFVLFLFYILGF